ncbi:hypothetical protein GCM10023145_15180 [Angustibacter luteus]
MDDVRYAIAPKPTGPSSEQATIPLASSTSTHARARLARAASGARVRGGESRSVMARAWWVPRRRGSAERPPRWHWPGRVNVASVVRLACPDVASIRAHRSSARADPASANLPQEPS